jgi:hypothetical protein
MQTPQFAGSTTHRTLKMPRKTLRAVRSALAHHQRVKASLVVRVKDSAGNLASKTERGAHAERSSLRSGQSA